MSKSTKEILSQPTKEQIDTLKQLSGEGQRNKINIPRIVIDYRSKVDGQINENYGGFSIVDNSKDGDGNYEKTHTPLGKTIECVILKRRNIAKRYDAKSEKTTHFSYEFDGWPSIEIFNDKKESLGIAPYKEQKAKYDLIPKMVLYIWFKENIHRLVLSAASMFSFGDYEREFDNSHLSLSITRIGTTEEQKSDSAPIYFLATFEKINYFPYEHAKELVGGLNEALKAYEGSRNQHEPEHKDVGDEKVDIADLPF